MKLAGEELELTIVQIIVHSPSRMRLKIRYVIMALVLMWLLVSVLYLFPFLFASREPPSVVSPVLALPHIRISRASEAGWRENHYVVQKCKHVHLNHLVFFDMPSMQEWN